MKPTILFVAVLLFCFSVLPAAAQDTEKINTALDEAAILYSAADYKGAVAKFEEALRLDPSRPSTHYNAASCYEALGDNAKAAAHLREYLRLSPNAEDRKEVESWLLALEPKAKKKPAAAAAAGPLVAPPSEWVVRTGIFMCGNQCSPEDVGFDPGWLAGVEYWDPLKGRNVVVYGLFYSRSSYDWTTFNISGDMDYLQFSASYLWGAGGRKSGSLDGLYYGLGLGYGRFSFSGAFDDSDSTIDINGLVGYNFGNSIATEGAWVIDENIGTLSVGYRF